MILIHAAGNEKIGVGNLSRCKTLANELVKRQIKDVVMIYEATKELAEKFLPQDLDLYVVKDRKEALNVRDKIIYKYKNEKEKSILVTDVYNLEEKDSKFARKQGFNYLVHLNDSGIPEYKADLVVDQEAFLKPWLKSEEIKFLHGAKYNIMKLEITQLRENKPWDKEKVENILLCFGGADPGNYIEKFINYYNDTSYIEDIQFTVVVGPGVNIKRWDKIRKTSLNNVQFKRSPNNIGKLIVDNDIIVTLGGITSYESMCIGRPVACISLESMEYYIEQLDKYGLVENLGTEYEAFNNLMALTKDINKLRSLSNNGWNEVDGKGVYRVIDCMVSSLS
ncbi:hypothetical protein [Clostridium botulinum]